MSFKQVKRSLRLLGNGTRGLIKGYRVGEGTRISTRAMILPRRRGAMEIGRNCIIDDYAVLDAHGGKIILGDYVSVNPFTVLYGHGGLTIGNDVRIAAHCVMIPANHNFSDPERPIRTQGLNCKGIIIEDDVWIGANVTILDGVRVARACVIAAGAVVSRSTDPFGVYAGVPARRIKERQVYRACAESIFSAKAEKTPAKR